MACGILAWIEHVDQGLYVVEIGDNESAIRRKICVD